MVLLLASALWAAKAIPPSPRSYVHNEGVVSSAAESRLSATLRSVEESTGHQFVAALFDSLEGEGLEDYSNRVFRAWRIGGAKDNDGLLFCLYKQDRKWRVEVGYGLEHVITDLEAAELAREGVPFFKDGDFDGGVQAVVDALAAKLEGRAPARAKPVGADGQDTWSLGWLIFFILAAFILNAFTKTTRAYGVGHSYRSWGGGGGWSSGGGGGFSGGGGSSGGGGASGGW